MRRKLLSILTTGLIVGLLTAALGPGAVAAAKAKIQDVFITNTAEDPVPVAGSVNVGNLPATQTVDGTVDIGNLPATQTVDGTVDIGNLPATQTVDGTVSVSNSPDAPLHVQPVDDTPEREYFHRQIRLSNQGDCAPIFEGETQHDFPRRPAVVESINVTTWSSSGNQPEVELTIARLEDSFGAYHHIFVGMLPAGHNRWSGQLAGPIRAPGGNIAYLLCHRGIDQETTALVTGYYID